MSASGADPANEIDEEEVGNALANLFAKIPPGEDSDILVDDVGDGEVDDWVGKPCKQGFVCEGRRQISCDNLRKKAIDFGLGDIHAGAYCPGNETSREKVIYENCEVGYYCPDSKTKIICPEGYFCPWKTAQYEIRCSNCKPGSKIMARNLFGFYILIFVAVFVFLCITLNVYMRKRRSHRDRIRDLQKRHFDTTKSKQLKKEREEKLQKIRPKLLKISERLQELQSANDFVNAGSGGNGKMPIGRFKSEGSTGGEEETAKRPSDNYSRMLRKSKRRGSKSDISVDSASTGISIEPSRRVIKIFGGSSEDNTKITFDPAKIFEAIDADKSGDLTYDELEPILDLTPFQLREFIRRMNRLAGLPSENKSVTKMVFVKFFLSVLEVSSNFAPTRQEVENLFDDIKKKQGSDRDGDIFFRSFYLSQLTDFLNDSQINDMIKSFQRLRLVAIESEQKSGSSERKYRANIFRKTNAVEEDSSGHLRRNLRRRGSESSVASASGRHGGTNTGIKHNAISRDDFVEHYPSVLLDILGSQPDAGGPVLNFRLDDDGEVRSAKVGVDITFENLCLEVKLGSLAANVVDHVSGRLQVGSMTALMGGSGAGKTSLLNALCGRAFYGEVTGTIKINGHSASIEDHKSSVGFVPQDDIVYAELTVRENFMFSGRFMLARGTSEEDIEDLADATMANLGLARVADTMVGDVSRRGVSGGEKKRVNIGMELMAKPSILFLDEPTSGLDSSSALLVMTSLKNLVDSQGVTVCSVIHQPRKIIFELFDNVILLGEGGRMVFHGPVVEAVPYFESANYDLPPGESVPDWLIDIASGRLAPKSKLDKIKRVAPRRRGGRNDSGGKMTEGFDDFPMPPGAGGRRGMLERQDSNTSVVSHDATANLDDEAGSTNEVHFDGPSGAQFARANDMAKLRRDKLFRRWTKHFRRVSKKKDSMYEAPDPFPLPVPKVKPTFGRQLWVHLRRHWIVWKRNWLTKLIDTTIIVASVMVISFLDGVVQPTEEAPVNVEFDELTSRYNLPVEQLFAFSRNAYFDLLQYGLKVGVVVAVLIGLTATKILTDKKVEFFHEARNGYNINAYFLAVNIVATLEHSIQVVITALFALWIRNTITHGFSYIVNFLMLCWLCVSWAMLIPILVPQKNVVLVTGFCMTFFSLLFSGAISPVFLEDIYSNKLLAVFCGVFSPTRFFIESLAISESRCLPAQSGFADLGPEAPDELYVTYQVGAALNDFDRVTRRSCSGWYWGVLPAFLVGLTVRIIAAGAINVRGNGKLGKKPIQQEIKQKLKQNDPRLPCLVIAYSNFVVGLLFISAVIILKSW